MILINVVACEFCGHSERFRSPDQVGSDLDIYDVVRARICKHEQRCEKNPLVKAIMDIRRFLENDVKEAPETNGYAMINEVDLACALSETFDCLGPGIEKPPPKPKRPTARPRIEIEPGAVAVGSKVQIVSRRKPGAVQAKTQGDIERIFWRII